MVGVVTEDRGKMIIGVGTEARARVIAYFSDPNCPNLGTRASAVPSRHQIQPSKKVESISGYSGLQRVFDNMIIMIFHQGNIEITIPRKMTTVIAGRAGRIPCQTVSGPVYGYT